jgi:soluble cytochrome b562
VADRKLVVSIIGDDRSLQAAFARSSAAASKFDKTVKSKIGRGVSVSGNFKGLLDDTKAMQAEADELSKRLENVGKAGEKAAPGLATVGARAGALGLAFTAAFQGSQKLGDLLDVTGAKAFTTAGRFQNFGASLARLDIVGAIAGLSNVPKTLDDIGISANNAAIHIEDFKKLSESGFAADLGRQGLQLVASLKAAEDASDALADSTARLGQAFRDSTGKAVTFKGAVDDLGGPRGPGLVDQINTNLEANRFPKFPKPLKPLGPTAKNQAAQTLAQANEDLPELMRLQKVDRDRLAKALAGSQGNVKQREALNQQFAVAKAAVIGTEKAIKAQADAAKDSAAAAAKLKREDAFAKILAALQLGVDKAGLTAILRDDLDALQSLKVGLLKQIKAGVDVVSAQRQLVGVVGQIADTQAEIGKRKKAAADAAKQARQFRELGLSASGDEIIPGVQNLATRVQGALRRINSGQLDVGSKVAERLKLARNTIKKEGKNLTDDTRRIINELLKTLDTGVKQSGPITKTQGLNADKVLAGLGLSPEQQREARARLSSVNTAGRSLAGDRRPTGGFTTAGAVVIQNETTVNLDGERLGRSVTKTQQKQRRRNPKQKSGPNSGV